MSRLSLPKIGRRGGASEATPYDEQVDLNPAAYAAEIEQRPMPMNDDSLRESGQWKAPAVPLEETRARMLAIAASEAVTKESVTEAAALRAVGDAALEKIRERSWARRQLRIRMTRIDTHLAELDEIPAQALSRSREMLAKVAKLFVLSDMAVVGAQLYLNGMSLPLALIAGVVPGVAQMYVGMASGREWSRLHQREERGSAPENTSPFSAVFYAPPTGESRRFLWVYPALAGVASLLAFLVVFGINIGAGDSFVSAFGMAILASMVTLVSFSAEAYGSNAVAEERGRLMGERSVALNYQREIEELRATVVESYTKANGALASGSRAARAVGLQVAIVSNRMYENPQLFGHEETAGVASHQEDLLTHAREVEFTTIDPPDLDAILDGPSPAASTYVPIVSPPATVTTKTNAGVVDDSDDAEDITEPRAA
jgi:hypothetical protein